MANRKLEATSLTHAARCLMLGVGFLTTVACGSTPTAPSRSADTPGELSGQWFGTTAQGTSIVITVSPDQNVKAISVGYRFPGCSGEVAFSDLALAIEPSATPTPPIGVPRGPSQQPSGPAFFYAAGPLEGPDHVQIYGTFGSPTRADGFILFNDYRGCGSGVVIWNASRR
jgi:hypothetical protein